MHASLTRDVQMVSFLTIVGFFIALTTTGTWLADLGHLERLDKNQSADLSLHGVDLSGSLFRQDPRLDLRQHNLKEKFPASWNWSNSFDLVHQRLLV